MYTKSERLSLANLGQGETALAFDQALSRVLENIMDPETDPKAERSINIKIIFRPNSEREISEVEAVVKYPKLASHASFFTNVLVSKNERNQLDVYEFKPEQLDLFAAQRKKVSKIANG